MATIGNDKKRLRKETQKVKFMERQKKKAKMEEVFKDPQVIFREMQLNFGQLQGVASPFKFSDAKLNMRKPSPRLGQDDTEF